MARDPAGTYSYPPGIEGAPDQTIDSSDYNAFLFDIQADLNYPRPITSGGTGAINAIDAMTNLGGELAKQTIVNYDMDPFYPGSFYSASSATGTPVSPGLSHAFIGICYATDNNNMVIEARDESDTALPGRKYVREKKGGTWGPWKSDGRTVIGTSEGIGVDTGDMFFGVTGTSPTSQFVVNAKADVSGSNLLTVRRSDGVVRGNGICPAGALMDFATLAAPAGWLPCDGTGYATSLYPDLFAAIAYTWGGTGTTFNVPNLIGRYRRNTGGNAGGVGALQGDTDKPHTHRILGDSGAVSADHTHHIDFNSLGTSDLNHQHGGVNAVTEATSGGFVLAAGANYVWHDTFQNTGYMDRSIDHVHRILGDTGGISTNHSHHLDFTSQGGSADGVEVRPISATVLTCIKV